MKRFLLLGALALLCAGIPFSNSLIYVANTTALRGMNTTGAPPTVVRLTDGVAGSAPLGYGADTGGVCKADDGGRCIAAANSGAYWLAQFPPGPRDVRWWGAPSDGVTDAGAAIASCLAVSNACLIPTSTNGFFVNTAVDPIVVPAGKALVGEFAAPSGGSPSAVSFAGSSWLLCASTASVACVSTSSITTNTATVIRDIEIAGVSGAPTSGSIGLKLHTGYNLQVLNVGVYNQDTCVLAASAASTGGIAADFINPHLGACQTYPWLLDGWPELRVTGGRTGTNGGTDYAVTAMVGMENDICSSAGCGPNGPSFVNHQFNPGGVSAEFPCFLKFFNFTPTYNQANVIKFIGDHIESLTTTGTFLCSDSTATLVSRLIVADTTIYNDGGGTTRGACSRASTRRQSCRVSRSPVTTFSNLGWAMPVTAGDTWMNVRFTDNDFVGTGLTFNINPTGNIDDLYLTNNSFSGALNVDTSSGGSIEKMTVTGGEVGTASTWNLQTTAVSTIQVVGTTFENNLTIEGSSHGNQSVTLEGVELYGTDTFSGDWKNLVVTGSSQSAFTNTSDWRCVPEYADRRTDRQWRGLRSKYVCVDANGKMLTQDQRMLVERVTRCRRVSRHSALRPWLWWTVSKVAGRCEPIAPHIEEICGEPHTQVLVGVEEDALHALLVTQLPTPFMLLPTVLFGYNSNT